MKKKLCSMTAKRLLRRLRAILQLISFLAFCQPVLLITIALADDCELKKWRLAED